MADKNILRQDDDVAFAMLIDTQIASVFRLIDGLGAAFKAIHDHARFGHLHRTCHMWQLYPNLGGVDIGSQILVLRQDGRCCIDFLFLIIVFFVIVDILIFWGRCSRG